MPSTTTSPDDHDLLRRLGHSVRHWRRVRGHSRRALAEISGVSARFLALVEAGDANISLRRLDELARALDLPLSRLLEPLPGEESLRVGLLGLRGAGKSTIGARIARHLQVPFIELDALIEEAAGLPISQIFEIHGEDYFRRLERETLRRFLSESESFVLATGGGLVTEPETLALLREGCTTVWLSALPEDHYNRVLAQGDERPMAGNPHAMAELRALLAARKPLYQQANLTVDTSSRSIEGAAQAIADQVRAMRD
jgi:XRE family aerobic/anaerobic benzoate catabolism transcriptional regulator